MAGSIFYTLASRQPYVVFGIEKAEKKFLPGFGVKNI